MIFVFVCFQWEVFSTPELQNFMKILDKEEEEHISLVCNLCPDHIVCSCNRPVHALSCIMGNRGKMAGNSKVCIGLQSQLILPELIYLTLSLFQV